MRMARTPAVLRGAVLLGWMLVLPTRIPFSGECVWLGVMDESKFPYARFAERKPV